MLRRGGYLIFEVGEGQAEAVQEMLMASGFAYTGTKKDTLDTDRVVFGRM